MGCVRIVFDCILKTGTAERRSCSIRSTGKERSVTIRLNHLLDMEIIRANGNRHSPSRTYEIKDNFASDAE